MSVRRLVRQGLPHRPARRLAQAGVDYLAPGTFYVRHQGKSHLFDTGDELLAFLSGCVGPVTVYQAHKESA